MGGLERDADALAGVHLQPGRTTGVISLVADDNALKPYHSYRNVPKRSLNQA